MKHYCYYIQERFFCTCFLQLQFESYLKKLAINSLKMTADEYQHLREEHPQDWVMNELQRKSAEKGLASYNLWALKESLLRDQCIATRTHHEWQPTEVFDLSSAV